MRTNTTVDKGMGRGGTARAVGWVMAVLWLMTAAAGCAGPEKPAAAPKPTFMEEWRQKAEASQGHSPVQETYLKMLESEIAQAAQPAPERRESESQKAESPSAEGAAIPEKRLPTDEISMKMHDVDLAVLLRALARIANQNILINENVAGKTSVNIQRAPWDQVFLGVLRTHGLTYQWEKEILRIITIKDLTNELALKKEQQNFKIESEKYKSDIHSLQKKNEPFITQVIPIRYGELEPLRDTLMTVLQARQAAAQAEAVAGGGQAGAAAAGQAQSVQGEVLLDTHSHSLVIHARRGDMAKLVGLIQELDRPTPQIRIEAHIVEATESTARDLGVQWGGLYLNASGDAFNWFGSQGSQTGQSLYDTGTLTPTLAQPTTGNIVNALTENLAAGTGGSLAYQFQKKGIGFLNIQLKALQDDGKLNIMSRPSITTLDNQEATIKSGTEVPFQTVEDGEVKIAYKEAVLRLTVVPHIIDGKSLRLKITTNNDSLDFANAVGGQPAITTRSADTNVVLFDGQTTVIGGLSQKRMNQSEAGVPGLKDVPGLGSLFKGTSKSDNMDELLIFITPHILKEQPVPVPATQPAQ